MMKKLHLTQSLAILALAVFMLLPGKGWGQTYTKITSLAELTDGKYVVAYGTTFAMNNTNAGSFFTNTAITPTGVSITAPAAAIIWKIQTHVDGGRTIYNETSATYVSFTGSSNAAQAVASVTGGAQRWTFAWSTTVFTIANVATPTRLLQYNTSSPRFACYLGTQQNITLYKLASPTITATGTFNVFTTTIGTPSASQSVAVSGSNLTSTIEVLASSGYEYSTNDAAPWTSTLSLASSFSGNVYARLTGASLGNYNGNISFSSTGATQIDKPVTGTVNPLTPVINVTGTFSAFTTTVGTPSASQALAVSGSNLTSAIDVAALAGFEYSTNDAAPWTTTLTLASSFSGSVYVRLTGTSLGSPSGNVTFTSTGATQVDKAASGTVTVPPPTLAIGGTFTAFATAIGVPSVAQFVTVSGSNLTSTIEVLALAGYEYSTTNLAPWTSTLSLLSSFSGIVYVRLTGAVAGTFAGNVSFTSTGATQVDKTASGIVSCAVASFPFTENFDYPLASLLTANCWSTHSGTSNFIAVTTPSISYPGYLSSGIGNEVTMATSGEDVNRAFTSTNTGDLYASILVNVTSTQTGGDYFAHFGATAGAALNTFGGRIWVRKDVTTSNFAFGLSSKTSSSVNYTGFTYVPGITYLVVVKYSFVSGTTNDVAVLYINPTLNAVEPSPILVTTATDDAGNDLAQITSFCLRQGASGSAPVLKLDGIRVSTVWADIAGALPLPTTYTGVGNWSEAGNWSNGIPSSGIDAIIDGAVTIDVAAATKDLTIFNGRSVTINAIKSLTVNGALANSAGTSGMIVKSGASLIESTPEIYGTVERSITGSGSDWHLVSAPISDATANSFYGMYLQSFTATPLAPYTTAPYGYTDITDPLTGLNVMEGYGAYSTAGTSSTVSFSGKLNTGEQFHAISLNGFNPQGWNLLGNPYPSSIDWETVTIPSGMSNEVHYIDAATGGDLVYVKGTGGSGSQYIPAMQGFFVSTTTGGTFSVNDANRSNLGSGTYYKSANSNAVVIEASGNGYSDQAWIQFNELAGVEHDGVYDAYKRISASNVNLPQIFSYTPSGLKLAINGMPEKSEVPFGFTAAQSGTFTLQAIQTGDLSIVTLEDTKTATFTNLLTNAYTFNFVAGENENRFVLHFGTLSVNETKSEDANIYGFHKTVFVNMKGQSKGDIYIYNIAGQLVASKAAAQGMNEIGLAVTGNYVVKVITRDSSVVRKVFVD